MRALAVLAIGCASAPPPHPLAAHVERGLCERAIEADVRAHLSVPPCIEPRNLYAAQFAAANCLAAEGELEGALAGYRLLASGRGEVAQAAMLEIVHVEARLGRYRDAALELETFANLYAGDAEAPAGLVRAIEYRAIAGDDRLARADLARYERAYGRKRKLPALVGCLVGTQG